jgi:hypothetical protein
LGEASHAFQQEDTEDLAANTHHGIKHLFSYLGEALERYRADHQARTDALVGTLGDLVVAYRKEGTTDERIAAMDTVIGDKASEVRQSCEEHLARVGNNNQQFLWPFYKQHRAQLFRVLSVMNLSSSSQDQSLEEIITSLKRNAQSKGVCQAHARLAACENSANGY